MDTNRGRLARVMAPSVRSPAAANDEAKNKRFAQRRKSALPGLVFPEGVNTSIPCLIVDMSTTGARLELKDGWDNPFRARGTDLSKLTLVIRHDKVAYDCKIVRCSEKSIGVKFLSSPRVIGKK